MHFLEDIGTLNFGEEGQIEQSAIEKRLHSGIYYLRMLFYHWSEDRNRKERELTDKVIGTPSIIFGRKQAIAPHSTFAKNIVKLRFQGIGTFAQEQKEV